MGSLLHRGGGDTHGGGGGGDTRGSVQELRRRDVDGSRPHCTEPVDEELGSRFVVVLFTVRVAAPAVE